MEAIPKWHTWSAYFSARILSGDAVMRCRASAFLCVGLLEMDRTGVFSASRAGGPYGDDSRTSPAQDRGAVPQGPAPLLHRGRPDSRACAAPLSHRPHSRGAQRQPWSRRCLHISARGASPSVMTRSTPPVAVCHVASGSHPMRLSRMRRSRSDGRQMGACVRPRRSGPSKRPRRPRPADRRPTIARTYDDLHRVGVSRPAVRLNRCIWGRGTTTDVMAALASPFRDGYVAPSTATYRVADSCTPFF